MASRTVGILDIGLDTDANGYQFLGSGGGTLTFDNGASAAQLNNLNTSDQQNARPIIQLPVVLNSDLDINNAGSNSNPANPYHLSTNIVWFNGQGLEGAATLGNTVYLSNVSSGTAMVYGNFGNNKLNDGPNGGMLGVIQNSGTSPLWLSSNPVGNYSGGTLIKNGIVVLQQNKPGTGGVTLGDAAGGSASLLTSGNVTVSNPINLATGAVGTLTLGGTNGTVSTTTFSGLIDLNGNTLTLSPEHASSVVQLTANVEIDPIGNPGVFGGFKGAGALVNVGTGTTRITANMVAGTVSSATQNSAGSGLVLSGTNTNTCTYTLSAGTLSFLKQASINGGISSVVPANVLVSTGTTLGLGVGSSPTYFDSTDVATVLTQMSLPVGSSIGLDTSAGNFAHSGAIGGAIGLTKLGNNTLTLSTTSTYSGGTTVAGGTLEIGADDNLGASGTAVTLAGGGVLSTGTATLVLTRPVVLNAGGGGFTNAAGGDLTVTGTVTGTEPLSVAGYGVAGSRSVKLDVGTLGGALTVGPKGSVGASLLISGYTLGTPGVTEIGDNTSNNNNSDNSVTVTGSSSVWNTGPLNVGPGGTNDGLSVSAGGKVNVTGNVTVAPYNKGSSGHYVTVTGVGSELAASGSFTISRMPDSSLAISAGGVVRASSYGQSDVVNCGVTVDGPNSLFALTGSVLSGSKQAGSSTSHYIDITNGGAMESASGTIGKAHGSGSNGTITVDGSGSTWTNTGGLIIQGNVGNILTVRNDGQVVGATSLRVGDGSGTSYQNNSALVQTNGLLQVGNSLTVGRVDSVGNTVTAETGGVLQFTSDTPTVTVGGGAGNAVSINGGTLSYKDVFTVDMNSNTTGTNTVNLFAWSGSNTLRLDNSDEIGVGAYTIANNLGATNFTGLELFDVTSVARALTLDGANGGTLRLDGATADLSAGGVTLGGSVTVTATGADSTLTGVLTGSGALVKTGSAKLTLASANTYSGNTTVSEGTLALDSANSNNQSSSVTIAVSGAVLELAFAGTDTVDKLFIGATQMSAGVYGVGNIVIPQITGSGTLTVNSGPGAASPFSTWAIAKGLDGTAGKENGPNDNPDTDGQTNLREFGFDGDPLNGANNAKIFGLTEDSDFDSPDTAKEMILTVAVRAGTPAFSGSPSPTASHDGITYTIEGSTTLSSFPTVVNVVPTPVTTGLPPVGAGYVYRSFSLAGSNGLTGKGFLHAKVTMP